MVKTHLPMQEIWETWVWSLVWKILWRRRWQPTPAFLPGKCHRQRSLASYSPWGYKESDKIEVPLHTHAHIYYQSSSVTQSCPTLCNPVNCSTPGFPNHHQLPEIAQTHVHQVSDAIQPYHPLSSPSLPAFNLSQPQGLFKVFNESVHIRWPMYWSFSFSISSSNEYSGLISFRINWLDLLAVQGTLKSLIQYHIQKHQLFSAQLSLWSNSHIHIQLLEKP